MERKNKRLKLQITVKNEASTISLFLFPRCAISKVATRDSWSFSTQHATLSQTENSDIFDVTPRRLSTAGDKLAQGHNESCGKICL